jgi:hypothetical protein
MMKAFVFLGLLYSVQAWTQERVYVVQALGENLGMVDVASEAVNADVMDLGTLANEIETDGSKLFVTSSQNVQIISTINHQVLDNFPLLGCDGTWASAVLSDDSIAVTCSISDALYVVRRSSGEVVYHERIGNAPQGILALGERLFVSLTRLEFPDYGPGAVMIFNRRTLQFEDSLETGINPQFMAIDPSGRLHVVCTGNYGDVPGEVDVFDLTNLTRVGTLLVGGTPSTVAFNFVYGYVAAGGWVNHGEVYRYRLQDLFVDHGVANPILVGLGAADIVCRTNGEILVSCFQDDVIERRSADGALLQTYELGDGPGYMVGMGTFTDAEDQPVLPLSIEVLKAYPNPFNGTVTIALGAPLSRESKMIIFNSLGQYVDDLIVPAGATFGRWSPTANGISSGNYWIKPTWSEATVGVRVTLLK